MAPNFNQYAAEGNKFLVDYAKEMVIKDTKKAGRILSSILHALRDIISTEESLQFIAQLPIFLKAIYVQGWSIKKKPRVKSMDDFMNLVRKYDEPASINDFGYENDILERYLNTTFLFLRKYVSPGEMEDIKSELPKKLKNMFYNKIVF